MKKYNNIEVDTIDSLRQLIFEAKCISEINNLRDACVKFMMDGHPEILQVWQNKFWALKKCPTCGKRR